MKDEIYQNHINNIKRILCDATGVTPDLITDKLITEISVSIEEYKKVKNDAYFEARNKHMEFITSK